MHRGLHESWLCQLFAVPVCARRRLIHAADERPAMHLPGARECCRVAAPRTFPPTEKWCRREASTSRPDAQNSRHAQMTGTPYSLAALTTLLTCQGTSAGSWLGIDHFGRQLYSHRHDFTRRVRKTSARNDWAYLCDAFGHSLERVGCSLRCQVLLTVDDDKGVAVDALDVHHLHDLRLECDWFRWAALGSGGF